MNKKETNFLKRHWKPILLFLLLGGFATLCFLFASYIDTLFGAYAVRMGFWLALTISTLILLAALFYDIKAQNPIRTISCVTGMIILRALIIIGAVLYIFTPNNFESISFDSSVWKGEKTARVSSSYPRLHMLKDLRKTTNDLQGFSRQQVIDILGPLEQHNRLPSPYDYAYYLGSDGAGLGLGAKWLAIDFENDRVVGVKEVFIND